MGNELGPVLHNEAVLQKELERVTKQHRRDQQDNFEQIIALQAGIEEFEKSRDLWRNRAHAAEKWYREEYNVDPHGEGIDVVYPWDHVGDELDLRPRHTGDKDDQQTTGNI